MSVRPKLVVGLGNPGREYVGTRHNVGFEAVERLAARWDCSFKRKGRFVAEVAVAALGERPRRQVVLAKPQTFMNRSGAAVAALAQWLKVAPPEILVVVDDADLPLGEIRLRSSGGSGGHNGLRSIIEALGGREEFARLRLGIGGGGVGEEISGHVLSRFSGAERGGMDQILVQAVAAVECAVENGLTTAMNQFNRRQQQAENKGEQR